MRSAPCKCVHTKLMHLGHNSVVGQNDGTFSLSLLQTVLNKRGCLCLCLCLRLLQVRRVCRRGALT